MRHGARVELWITESHDERTTGNIEVIDCVPEERHDFLPIIGGELQRIRNVLLWHDEQHELGALGRELIVPKHPVHRVHDVGLFLLLSVAKRAESEGLCESLVGREELFEAPATHQVPDLPRQGREAREFIGKCLEHLSQVYSIDQFYLLFLKPTHGLTLPIFYIKSIILTSPALAHDLVRRRLP
ncbi:MAG: hypothetical protein JWN90_601 [Parcubacteria group bacterium]|nr:hypothetical protein [Parcubacteria group bacterium]